MPESLVPFARIHRVTTRRQHLRELSCPLEPELLVAEFAGELPPHVARAVREHVAVCETCGARARALHGPYSILASVGREPVTEVPDLRDTVLDRVHSRRALRAVANLSGRLGRGGTIGVTAVLGLVVLVAIVAAIFVLPLRSPIASRSTNTLAHPPIAGAGGEVYAETNKLVSVSANDGASWQVAEVIAVNETNGAVTASLPSGGPLLAVAQHNQLPVATVVDAQGKAVFELTSVQNGRQALVAFDAHSGQVRFATPIMLPGSKALPSGTKALSVAVAPDGSRAYVSLSTPQIRVHSPRVLVINGQTGSAENVYYQWLPLSIPLPPPAGSLPAAAFPTSVPHLGTAGLKASEALDEPLALSPDGRWLFDTLRLTDAKGASYLVIQRMDAQTGNTKQILALPGAFTTARLAISPDPAVPQLYLVTGSPDATCYIVDASETGPTLEGSVALGGPPAAPGAPSLFESLSESPAANGQSIFITQDVTTADNSIVSHDIWVVDTQSVSLSAHRTDVTDEGDVLANSTGGAKGKLFLLSNGTVDIIPPDLTGSAAPWLQLNNGQPVTALLGTRP